MTAGALRSTRECYCRVWEHCAQFERARAHLEVLGSTGEIDQSIRELCAWLLNWFKLCWYRIHPAQHLPKNICCPLFLMITSWPQNVDVQSGMPFHRIDRHKSTVQGSSRVMLPHVVTVLEISNGTIDQEGMSCDGKVQTSIDLEVVWE